MRRLGPRLIGVAATLAVLLSSALLQPGTTSSTSSTADAAAAPVDYAKLEQQIVQQINEMRTNGAKVADALGTLTVGEDGRIVLPDGSSFPAGYSADLGKKYLEKSMPELRAQPAIAPLGWSAKVAAAARAGLPTANAGGNVHATLSSRFAAAGVNAAGIEGAGGSEPSALAAMMEGWVSPFDGWDLNSAFTPDYAGTPFNGRGHRGIINDDRENAIGVACAQSLANPKQAMCVMDLAFHADDTVVPPSAGTIPSLAQLPASGSGTVGSTQDPAKASLTIDTTKPTPSPTSTEGPVGELTQVDAAGQLSTPGATPSVPAAAPAGAATGSASPSSCGPVGGSTDGDLTFGTYVDPQGTGCFQVTVTPQEEFTPSAPGTVTGPATAEYRKYRVELVNRSGATLDGNGVVTPSCTTTDGSAALPVVVDPAAGQGLPNTPIGSPGAVQFGVGCGQGPDGYARVTLSFGPQLLGGRTSWHFQGSRAQASAAASAAASGAASESAAAQSCPGAGTDDASTVATAGVESLRCLLAASRAAAGLAPAARSSVLDTDAAAIVSTWTWKDYAKGSVCPGGAGRVVDSRALTSVGARTPQEAAKILTSVAALGGSTAHLGAAASPGSQSPVYAAVVVVCA